MTTAKDNPARFPAVILDEARRILQNEGDLHRILDPYAGEGRVHVLRPEFETWGIELEPEWAHRNEVGERWTKAGNCLDWRRMYRKKFDAIFTSPTWANRMGDSHDAKDDSKRNTYTHRLGRKLTEGNTGEMNWGPKYRITSIAHWVSLMDAVRPGGALLLDMGDHLATKYAKRYEGGKAQIRVRVTDWHAEVLQGLGWELKQRTKHRNPGQRYGANHAARIGYQELLLFRKP